MTKQRVPRLRYEIEICRTMIRFRPDFPFCDWPKSTLPSLSPVPYEPFLFQKRGSLHFGNFRWEASLEPSWIFAHLTSLSCCTTSTNFWVGSEHASSWGLIEDYKYDSDLGEISLRRICSESMTFDISWLIKLVQRFMVIRDHESSVILWGEITHISLSRSIRDTIETRVWGPWLNT
jgi:hypothetical protein